MTWLLVGIALAWGLACLAAVLVVHRAHPRRRSSHLMGIEREELR